MPALLDFFIDIDLLDSTAAFTALCEFYREAYDGPLTLVEGTPYPIRMLN